MILHELNLPYEAIQTSMADVKKPEFTAINPNGRLPAIQDPNTGITLWESGAIVEYLIDEYDKDHKISFPAGSPETYHARQWLHLQATGQGPYYGQLIWFLKFHGEKVPSAIERYTKEYQRLSGVLEEWLEGQKKAHPNTDGPWLVGDKMSFADIAFIPWQTIPSMVVSDSEELGLDGFPLVKDWIGKMKQSEGVKAAEAAAAATA